MKRFFVALMVALICPLSGITVFTAFTTLLYGVSVSFKVTQYLSISQIIISIIGMFISKKSLEKYGRKSILMTTLIINAVQITFLTASVFLLESEE